MRVTRLVYVLILALTSCCWVADTSGKTILERSLACDGVQEFVFYQEYPGRTNQFPNTYYCGAFQGGNFLVVKSSVPLHSIPDTLTTNLAVAICARFERTWWSVHTTPHIYDRRIWAQENIPDEENNELERECRRSLQILMSCMLNLGLEHSNADMEADAGGYTNAEYQVAVDYKVSERSPTGLPKTILAHAVDLAGVNPPSTWQLQADYGGGNREQRAPISVTRYLLQNDGEARLLDRIVIEKAVPATSTLREEDFLRPQFSVGSGFPNPMTYYLHTNRFIGVDAKSNLTVRFRPDDPRLLRTMEKKPLIVAYWIVAVLITAFAGICAAWNKLRGKGDGINK